MISVAQKQNTCPVCAKVLCLILSLSKTKQRLEDSLTSHWVGGKTNKKNTASNSLHLLVMAKYYKYNYLLRTACHLPLMPLAMQNTARNTDPNTLLRSKTLSIMY